MPEGRTGIETRGDDGGIWFGEIRYYEVSVVKQRRHDAWFSRDRDIMMNYEATLDKCPKYTNVSIK